MAVSPLERRRLRRWTALRARELRSTPGADWMERTLMLVLVLKVKGWGGEKKK